jgi:hypothetical protein
MLKTSLLQRPSDRAISGSIGFGVRELLLVRVQEARNVALGGDPAEFLSYLDGLPPKLEWGSMRVEEGQQTIYG